MSQPKRDNADGTYTPIPTMNKAEWDALRALPVDFPVLGSRQVTVNSEERLLVKPNKNQVRFSFGLDKGRQS